jgi:hypothetical protein
MNGSHECGHCRRFFLDLHRRCTINLNGECDCPICQGICNCEVPAREAMPKFEPVDNGPPPTRKFGDPR